MAKLLPVEKRVLELIKEKGYIDVKYVSRKTGLPIRDISKIIDSLVRKNMLFELPLCNVDKCNYCPLRSFCPIKGSKKAKVFVLKVKEQ